MIILFGVVGSGKSEQAKRLLTHFSCPYISTSHLLREHLTPARQEAMAAGKLVNDEEVLELLGPALKDAKANIGECILDGAPRSIGQAKWLIDKIKAGDVSLTAIVHLKVSKEVVLDRLLSRGRDDDKKEIISQRFSEYDQVTTPVLDYMKDQGYIVDEVDASQPPEVVEDQIQAILARRK